MTRKRQVRRVLTWALLVMVIVTVEYITRSNVDPYPVYSDTLPYSARHSLIPLPWPVARVLIRTSVVTLQPLDGIYRHAIATKGKTWMTPIARAVYEQRSESSNILRFTVVNSLVWIVGFIAMRRIWGLWQRRKGDA